MGLIRLTKYFSATMFGTVSMTGSMIGAPVIGSVGGIPVIGSGAPGCSPVWICVSGWAGSMYVS